MWRERWFCRCCWAPRIALQPAAPPTPTADRVSRKKSAGSVKLRRIAEITLRIPVKRTAHNSSARSRAIASCAETATGAPLSISLSRSAASRSHASSRAVSASRLATARSSKRARSTDGKRSSSASSASMGSGMAITLGGCCPSVARCHRASMGAAPRAPHTRRL